MTTKCPQGHWYEPDVSGGVGHCPQCATQTRSGSTVSDDDILAIMSGPETHHDSVAKHADTHPAAPIMRRKKICPDCSHEASFSFDYCPRCGAPLKIASVELH